MVIALTALALASDPGPEVTSETPSETSAEAEVTPEAPAEPAPQAPSEPEPAEEPDVFTIEVDDADLGSALTDFSDKSRRMRDEDPAMLDDWLGLNRPVLFRSRWFIKPLLSWANLQGRSAVRPGLALGHQWFPVAELPIQVAGETRLSLGLPAGGAKGRSIELSSTAGPWLGPVGVRVGPALRWDKWTSETATLDDALALGARATLAVDADLFHPWVGIEPVWLVAGDREAWGAIGELSMLAGLTYAFKMAQIGAQGTWRETSEGRWLDIGMTLHVRPR